MQHDGEHSQLSSWSLVLKIEFIMAFLITEDFVLIKLLLQIVMVTWFGNSQYINVRIREQLVCMQFDKWLCIQD